MQPHHPSLSFVYAFLNDHPTAELFLVGGSVRDQLMKRKTTEADFDFVIRKLPAKQIEQWFAKYGTIDFVGRTFGVYKFYPHGIDPQRYQPIDIALPRTEQSQPTKKGAYKAFDVNADADLPIEEDLSRRDFTINAIAINMRTQELIDPFGGKDDLQKKLISAVGNPNERFEEDYSRMLRAVRLASELNFNIETETLKAIQDHISHLQDKHIQDGKEEYLVPRETIGVELAKGFARSPHRTLEWLKKINALSFLFGSCISEDGLRLLAPNHPTIAMALLLRGCNAQTIPDQLAQIGLDSLPRYSPFRIEPNMVSWLIVRLQQPWNETVVRETRASLFEKTFMTGERSNQLLIALHALQKTAVEQAIRHRINEISKQWDADLDEVIHPLLSGDDLLSAGVPAGPSIRLLLESLRDKQLDGCILTREAAKKWLSDQTKNTR